MDFETCGVELELWGGSWVDLKNVGAYWVDLGWILKRAGVDLAWILGGP